MLKENETRTWILLEDIDNKVADAPAPKEIARVFAGSEDTALKVSFGFPINPGTPFDLPSQYAAQLAQALTEGTAALKKAPITS